MKIFMCWLPLILLHLSLSVPCLSQTLVAFIAHPYDPSGINHHCLLIHEWAVGPELSWRCTWWLLCISALNNLHLNLFLARYFIISLLYTFRKWYGVRRRWEEGHGTRIELSDQATSYGWSFGNPIRKWISSSFFPYQTPYFRLIHF